MEYEYGDRVLVTYEPYQPSPQPITREGVVVCPDFGDDMAEVWFGTLEDYEALLEEDLFQEAHDKTGVFYPHELTSA